MHKCQACSDSYSCTITNQTERRPVSHIFSQSTKQNNATVNAVTFNQQGTLNIPKTE